MSEVYILNPGRTLDYNGEGGDDINSYQNYHAKVYEKLIHIFCKFNELTNFEHHYLKCKFKEKKICAFRNIFRTYCSFNFLYSEVFL